MNLDYYVLSVVICKIFSKLDAKAPLGMGEYGIVYKGTILGRLGSDGDPTPVAIKTIKPSAGVQCLRSLLKEIKVMLHVGKHANIACLIGCCTENIRKGIDLEYQYQMSRGLKSFFWSFSRRGLRANGVLR